MKHIIASLYAFVAGRTVDAILKDFNTKLEQLETLIDTKQYLQESYTERIMELEKERGQVEAEIDRAAKVHAQITKLIVGKE